MRIVITGGTGIIGTELVRSLSNSGHTLQILSRNPDRHRSSVPGGVTLHQWDGKTTKGWAELIDGADVVINFAGENLAGYRFFPDRWTPEKKALIHDSRADAGAAVVEAIRMAQRKPHLLVQSSAIGYYGPRGPEPIAEDEGPGQDFLASVCIEWEKTTQPVEEMGVRRIVTRTGLIMTTEGGPLQRLLLPGPLVAGPFGLGNQYWSWVHLEDTIAALHYLVEHDSAAGAFNLTGPEPVTNRDLTWTLAKVTRSLPAPVPSFALKLMVGEVATVVLDGQRVLPQHLEQLGYEFRFRDVEATFRNLLRS